MPESRVSLATRADIFRLVAFLDHFLPEENDIHSFVLSTLLVKESSQQVYFIESQDAVDNFKSILTVKEEKAHDNSNSEKMLRVWNICVWAVSDQALIDVCNVLDVMVDWECDEFCLFGRTKEPHSYFANRVKKPLHCYPVHRFGMEVSAALELEANSLDDVYVKSLERHDAQAVFEFWPYKASTTVQDLADEFAVLPSAGVYLKSTDQLVAWMNLHPPNGMSRLHTLEEHRRKGYATLLTQYLTKRVAQSGHYPYVHIVVGNTASEQFFKHMGFLYQGLDHIHTTFNH